MTTKPLIRLAAVAAALVLAAPATSGAQQQAAPWALVWSDEFNGTALDRDKWNVENDCWGGGNEERQCYVDRPENLQVGDGRLSIIARRETTTGPALPPHIESGLPANEQGRQATKEFSSARLNSRGKGDWLYGRIEVRAKPPQGQGTWSAVWMLPTENYYGAWAASGEIDIMEVINLGTRCDTCAGGIENEALGTIHYGGVWPRNTYAGKATPLPPSADGYHVYAVQWDPGRITWLLDGQPYASMTFREWRTEAPRRLQTRYAPFDRPFHLILNLAIGGNLAESQNDRGVNLEGYPKTLEIDWVRVFQRQEQQR
jgi:beta-glucanase (GH16 family)